MYPMEHIWTIVMLEICKHTFYAYLSRIWKMMQFTRTLPSLRMEPSWKGFRVIVFFSDRQKMLKQPNKSCFFQTTSIVKIVLSTLSIKPPFFKVPSIKSIINLDKKSSSPSPSSSMSTTSSGTSTVHFDGSNQMTIDRRQEIAAEAQDITLRSHYLFQQRNSDNVKFNHVKIQLQVDV